MNQRHIKECLQGLSCRAFEEFGAHFCHEYEQDGVRFAVYAPNAVKVCLIGSFNDWNGYEMQRDADGVWSIFAADIPEGSLYKFQITTCSGEIHDRMDPFAFFSEVRPNTASIVCRMEGYSWADQDWMSRRNKCFHSPVSIYEVHAGSWKRHDINEAAFPSYTELAYQLIPYVKEQGFTHIELLPLTEHPLDGSWGYQTAGYFSATSRYGSPSDLMELVNECHQNGIGVIIDFVPAHFVTDFYALHQFDGGFVFESEHPELRLSEWQTALFDYTKPFVQCFIRSALEFWIEYYHIDGVRYDAVANMVYHHGKAENGLNEAGIWFLKSTNFSIQQQHPDVMLLAEDSSSFIKVTAPVVYGGLGFDYKWSLGWMHDILTYLALPPDQRSKNHRLLTLSMSYFYQENYLLPFSHDEVVHGKKTILDKLYGSYEDKFSQLRSLYLYMFTHPGKKLNFMGNELAEFKEWDEDHQLGWNLLDYPSHRSFHAYFRELNRLYQQQEALFQDDYHSDGFHWLDANHTNLCLIAYQRRAVGGEVLYAVINFSSNLQQYQLKVSEPGVYRELINSDNVFFGGSGITNEFVETSVNQYGHALHISMAPYSACIFKQIQADSN